MEIRVATLADVEQIAQLFIEQFDVHARLTPYLMQPGPMGEDFIRKTITDEDSQFYLATEAGRAVGFVSVYQRQSPDEAFMIPRRYAYLMDIIVTQSYQGQGIASQLLDAAKEWAVGRGLDYIELTVESNNPAAGLYLKKGYEEAQKIMRHRL